MQNALTVINRTVGVFLCIKYAEGKICALKTIK